VFRCPVLPRTSRIQAADTQVQRETPPHAHAAAQLILSYRLHAQPCTPLITANQPQPRRHPRSTLSHPNAGPPSHSPQGTATEAATALSMPEQLTLLQLSCHSHTQSWTHDTRRAQDCGSPQIHTRQHKSNVLHPKKELLWTLNTGNRHSRHRTAAGMRSTFPAVCCTTTPAEHHTHGPNGHNPSSTIMVCWALFAALLPCTGVAYGSRATTLAVHRACSTLSLHLPPFFVCAHNMHSTSTNKGRVPAGPLRPTVNTPHTHGARLLPALHTRTHQLRPQQQQQ
jgi:hypothetical protein